MKKIELLIIFGAVSIVLLILYLFTSFNKPVEVTQTESNESQVSARDITTQDIEDKTEVLEDLSEATIDDTPKSQTPTITSKRVIVTALSGTEKISPNSYSSYSISPDGRWLTYMDNAHLQGKEQSGIHIYDIERQQDFTFYFDEDPIISFLEKCWIQNGEYCVISEGLRAFVQIDGDTPKTIDYNDFLAARTGYVFNHRTGAEIIKEVETPRPNEYFFGTYTDISGVTSDIAPQYKRELLTCADCALNDHIGYNVLGRERHPNHDLYYQSLGQRTNELSIYALDEGIPRLVTTFTGDLSKELLAFEQELRDIAGIGDVNVEEDELVMGMLDGLSDQPTCVDFKEIRLSPDGGKLAILLDTYLSDNKCSKSGFDLISKEEFFWVDLQVGKVYSAEINPFHLKWGPNSSKVYFMDRVEGAGFKLFVAEIK